MASFYEVAEDTIKKNYNRNQDEFDGDGVESLAGQAIRDGRSVISLPSRASRVTVYPPKAVLRMGFILRDSSIARRVRDAALNIIQSQPKIIESVKSAAERVEFIVTHQTYSVSNTTFPCSRKKLEDMWKDSA